MTNEEHAKNLQWLEQFEPKESHAASLKAGAAALRDMDSIQRFAEELSNYETPVLMGFAYQLQTILDRGKPDAALKEMEQV